MGTRKCKTVEESPYQSDVNSVKTEARTSDLWCSSDGMLESLMLYEKFTGTIPPTPPKTPTVYKWITQFKKGQDDAEKTQQIMHINLLGKN